MFHEILALEWFKSLQSGGPCVKKQYSFIWTCVQGHLPSGFETLDGAEQLALLKETCRTSNSPDLADHWDDMDAAPNTWDAALAYVLCKLREQPPVDGQGRKA